MKKITPSFWFMVRSRLQGKNFLYEFYFKDHMTLDVGCGNGEFVRIDPEKICGFDSNKSMIEGLKKQGLDVKTGDVSKMPYEDKSFARVHCRNVIEHLYPETAYKMLRESGRVLVSGGLLILGTEIPTRKFWGTFGHTKPYPPGAIRKLLREFTREEFEPIRDLEYVGVVYLGQYFKSRMLYFLSALLAYYTPLLRREYFIILRKR